MMSIILEGRLRPAWSGNPKASAEPERLTRFEKEAYYFLIDPFQNKLPSLLPLIFPCWNNASVASQELSIKDQNSPLIIGTDKAPFHCSCTAGSSLVMEEEEEEEHEEETDEEKGEEDEEEKQTIRVSHSFSNKHGLFKSRTIPLVEEKKQQQEEEQEG